jgi:hypothetical protein
LIARLSELTETIRMHPCAIFALSKLLHSNATHRLGERETLAAWAWFHCRVSKDESREKTEDEMHVFERRIGVLALEGRRIVRC